MGKLWGNVSNNCGEIGENNEKNCREMWEFWGKYSGKGGNAKKSAGKCGENCEEWGNLYITSVFDTICIFFSNTC